MEEFAADSAFPADEAPAAAVAAAQDAPVQGEAVPETANAEDELAYVQKALSLPLHAGKGGGRMLSSKMAKTAALLSHPSIAPHIPPTRPYTEANLKSMLEQHGMVVIKPVRGTGGIGVIKIERSGSGYSYTHSSRTRSASSVPSLHRALKPLQKGRAYMIQKGIQLATVGGRPIDYRVKYVKNGSRWEFRSMVGRVARPGLFVTNLCRGGSQLTAAQGISRSLSSKLVRSKKQEMRSLTRISASALEARFPGIGQLGFDYGLDKSGKIWIFEVNTRPK
ncbi:Putative uncharacterized protein [Paenibacillus sp. P22]|nr:Putative uncharacterized protein [Paenibacillus sp. P22]